MTCFSFGSLQQSPPWAGFARVRRVSDLFFFWELAATSAMGGICAGPPRERLIFLLGACSDLRHGRYLLKTIPPVTFFLPASFRWYLPWAVFVPARQKGPAAYAAGPGMCRCLQKTGSIYPFDTSASFWMAWSARIRLSCSSRKDVVSTFTGSGTANSFKTLISLL